MDMIERMLKEFFFHENNRWRFIYTFAKTVALLELCMYNYKWSIIP